MRLVLSSIKYNSNGGINTWKFTNEHAGIVYSKVYTDEKHEYEFSDTELKEFIKKGDNYIDGFLLYNGRALNFGYEFSEKEFCHGLKYGIDDITLKDDIKIHRRVSNDLLILDMYTMTPNAIINLGNNNALEKIKNNLHSKYMIIEKMFHNRFIIEYDHKYYYINANVKGAIYFDKIAEKLKLYRVHYGDKYNYDNAITVSFDYGVLIKAQRISLEDETAIKFIEENIEKVANELKLKNSDILVSSGYDNYTHGGLSYTPKDTLFLGYTPLIVDKKDIENFDRILKYFENNYNNILVKRKVLNLYSDLTRFNGPILFHSQDTPDIKDIALDVEESALHNKKVLDIIYNILKLQKGYLGTRYIDSAFNRVAEDKHIDESLELDDNNNLTITDIISFYYNGIKSWDLEEMLARNYFDTIDEIIYVPGAIFIAFSDFEYRTSAVVLIPLRHVNYTKEKEKQK